jgi:hypothetical protein
VYSALQNGLNYAVVPAVRPIEDFLTRVEKALKLLPAEMTEEARQEAVRIIKDSSRPRDNWTGAEMKALRALQTTTEHSIFPADKGNSAVVPCGLQSEIGALLRDPANERFAKDPTETAEGKTTLFLRSKHLQRRFANDYVPHLQDL